MSAKAAAAAQGEAPAPAEQGEGSQVLQLLHLHWSFDVVRREQRIVLFDTVYHDELVGNGLRVEIAQPWDSAETLQLQEHRLERAPTPVRPALLDNDVVPHRTRMVEMVLETRRNQVNCAKSKRSAVFQQRFEELRAALGASTTAAAATPASARQETKGAEGDSASAGGVQPAAQVRDACFAFFRAVGTHFVRVSMCGGAIYVTCDSKDPAALTLPKLRDDLRCVPSRTLRARARARSLRLCRALTRRSHAAPPCLARGTPPRARWGRCWRTAPRCSTSACAPPPT
jgi:hypothetical protein